MRLVTMLGALIAITACGSRGAFEEETKNEAADPVAPAPSLGGPAPPESAPGATCATGRAETERLPIELLLVVDGSGSMNALGKWDATTAALRAFFDALASEGDGSVLVGLTIFSDDADPRRLSGAPYDSADVPLAPADAAHVNALRARLATLPTGLTPTERVLDGQWAFLASAPPTAASRVVVLFTDGVPDDGAAEQARCETKAAAVRSSVRTAVVGIGDPSAAAFDYDVGFLARLALAGGLSRAGCSASERSDPTRMCHYQVTPGATTTAASDVLAAIDAIRETIVSCDLAIVANGAFDPGRVNVTLEPSSGPARSIAQDAANGWTYDDPTAPRHVVLHGAACEALHADARAKVEVVFGCPTIVD